MRTTRLLIQHQQQEAGSLSHTVDINMRGSQDTLDIDDIYHHLNLFIRVHSIKDPIVMLQSKEGKTRILQRDSEIDIDSEEDTPTIKVSVTSGSQKQHLLEELASLEDERQKNENRIVKFRE